MAHPAHNPDEPTPQDVARGHEMTDASPRALLVFAIWLVIGALIVHWIGWVCLNYVRAQTDVEQRAQHPEHPLSRVAIGPPPAPGVQPEPHNPDFPQDELAKVRGREAALLDGPVGWVDADHQFARIPLRQAIDIAVAQGLPAKLPATQPATQPFMPPASAVHGPGGIP